MASTPLPIIRRLKELGSTHSVAVRTRSYRAALGVALFIVLLSLGFVFLYPVLYMISTSLMTPADLVAPDVLYIPTAIRLDNYRIAILGLSFLKAAGISAVIALLGAAGHLVSCSLVGYGFARYKLKVQRVLFPLVIFTLIVPPQTYLVPLYIQFSRYGWINSILPFVVPAFVAQGLKGALFVIVFRQFFSQLPWELDDSARIDGAGGFRIFTRIMLPLSRSAMLVVFLFSFVWHWNDHYLPGIFLRLESTTLAVRLKSFWIVVRGANAAILEAASNYQQELMQAHSEGVGMAASFLVIVVPLVVYIFLQRYFTESIERTGLVE